MSIAYQCDRCWECYPGEPRLTEDGFDFCPSCVRVLEVFSKIDPFDVMNRNKKRSDDNAE